jgi:hypothetical protein
MFESDHILDLLTEGKKLYWREKVPPESLAAMVTQLADIPFPALALICRQLWRTNEYFPNVAVIRNAYISAVLPDDVDRSYAWVLSRMTTGDYSALTGRNAPPTDFPDDLTRETVAEISWFMLHTMSEYDRRRTYREAYKKLRDARISAASRGSMFDLGVAALGEGDGLQIVALSQGVPGPPREIDASEMTVSVFVDTPDGPRHLHSVPRLVTEHDATSVGEITGKRYCGSCGRAIDLPHRVNCQMVQS